MTIRPPTYAVMPRNLLILSLVLNIFLVGAIAGGWAMRLAPKAPPTQAPRGNLLRQAGVALSPESRRAFRLALRGAARDSAPTAADGRASRLTAADLMAAPTFDHAAVDAALDKARADDIAVRTRLERAAVAAIADLPPADRMALGKAMRQRVEEQQARQAAQAKKAKEARDAQANP